MKNEDRQIFRDKTLEGMDRLLECNPSGACAIIITEGGESGSMVHALGEFSANEILARVFRCLSELAEEMGISRDRLIASVLAAHFIATEQNTDGMKGKAAKTSDLKCGHA